MNPSEYNTNMAIVRGALAAERFKAVIRCIVTASYVYLLIEIIHYMAGAWSILHGSLLLVFGTPIAALVLIVRIFSRISRSF